MLPATRRSAARDVVLDRVGDLRGKIAALRKVPTPAEQEEAQKREEM